MMESPPFSTLSEGPPLSEDSGLLITSGSFSSDSASGWHHVASELQESDFDERSLSLCESTEASERMCGDFFNTVKKGPGKIILTTIEPPPEFQDIPCEPSCEAGGGGVPALVVAEPSPARARPPAPQPEPYERRLRRFHSPRLLPLSPGRAHRPASRTSLCSRLSTSHNSLLPQFPDDSSFITQAISHDALHAPTHITDVYTVPFDSDIYAVPVDTVRTHHRPKKPLRKKRAKSTHQTTPTDDKTHKSKERHKDSKTKRLSLPGSSTKKATESDTESLHLTLREMRKYLHTLYSSSSDSECKATVKKNSTLVSGVGVHRRVGKDTAIILKDSDAKSIETNNNHRKSSKNSFGMNIKNKKHKESAAKEEMEKSVSVKRSPSQKVKVSPVRILSMNLKQSFCNLFRWKRASARSEEGGDSEMARGGEVPAAVRRALPPLPLASQPAQAARRHDDDTVTADFATSIQKVKDYGWYWGPISVEGAEKILSNEPDGSFIVRDSSDDHYIFTLTFKLNGLRHVRIEHDQGNFCFGGCTMFKAATIVEFIENAVETSRSGRYLFFLNLRPVLGPVRVQLLYPVSRFKRVQSLQHMCRFVILKYVRRDLIPALPLPRRLVDYLGAAHYYSELLADI